MEKEIKALVIEDTGFYAEKRYGIKGYYLPEARCPDEKDSDDAVRQKLSKEWRIEPDRVSLLCALPKKEQNETVFVEYYYCTKGRGEFSDTTAEEIVLFEFGEKGKLADKNDEIAAEVYAKTFKPWLLEETARRNEIKEEGVDEAESEEAENQWKTGFGKEDERREAGALMQEAKESGDFEVWKPKAKEEKKQEKGEFGESLESHRNREGVDFEVWKPKKK